MDITLLHGDCREQLQLLIDQGIKVDSIVTDPPYEIGFMNKKFDKTGISHDVGMWKLCLEVLKPGGHLLSFGGTRTYHRMTCAIEDAGFEIRDCVSWVYGSGFPKSLDVSKAIDKVFGAERTADSAKQWSGFGTALKPAHEPIVLARKPLSEKTVAKNVLRHGCGALNIDGCRVGLCAGDDPRMGGNGVWNRLCERTKHTVSLPPITSGSHILGRFPANLLHDGSDEVEAEFAKYGEKKSGGGNKGSKHGFWNKAPTGSDYFDEVNTGPASRFFYCAKASKKERNIGLGERELSTTDDGRNKSIDNPYQRGETLRHNNHPTIKPIALMKYLCRLITPPGGTVLDPFLGSGSTGIAAKQEGFGFIGIEKESEYLEIATARIGVFDGY